MVILVDKILTQLAMPLGLGLLVLAYAVMAMAIGRRRQALTAAVVAGLSIWIFSTPLVANVLSRTLEERVSALPVDSYPVVDVAVLLGGALSPPDSEAGLFELQEASDRVVQAARLYRAGKAPRILIAGGNVFGGDGITEASAIADFLVFMGVARGDIILENTSRNTRENAVNSAAIWRSESFGTGLLVTSAMHMPRALAAFRKVGMDLTPVPIDYLSGADDDPLPLLFIPNAASLRISSLAIKELLGLLVYHWRGWA
jgi:uncharacterized SAM-binding protein YcdF (DUF218 family)